MIEPRPSATALAARVVAVERRRSGGGPASERAITTTLHQILGKLIGSSGTVVLVARALSVAERAEPGLHSVSVAPDGTLQGLPEEPGARARCLSAFLAHVMEFLIRFIGEDLVERIVGEPWPDLASDVERAPPKETNQ